MLAAAIVRELLKHPGIDVNILPDDVTVWRLGLPALHHACISGDYDVVMALLQHRSTNVNVRTAVVGGCLALAAGNGRLGVVMLLLKQPALQVRLNHFCTESKYLS